MLLSALALITLGPGEEPRILNDFKLRGSDGKRYTLETLTAGKPTLVFYLASDLKQRKTKGPFGEEYDPWGFEKPNGIPNINRLSTMAKGKLRVFAVTFADANQLAGQVKRGGLKVILLGDDERSTVYGLLNQMMSGYGNKRNLSHLQNMLIVPNPGREARIWTGYNRASLADMQRLVDKYTGVKLNLDLSRFPKAFQQGQTSMFGLPGP